MADTNDETIDFLDKLAQFHSTLSPTQQAMLDEMTAAALQAPEVEGFSLNFTSQQQLPLLRQGLLGNANNSALPYYKYYDNVAGLL